MQWLSFSLALGVLLGASAGCGDDEAAPDDGGDAADGGGGACEDTFSFEEGDLDGAADPLDVGPGQARAGRIAAAQLPADPAGLGTFAPNDFVLANDRIGVIVEDVGDSDIYDPWGGKIVGLAKVGDGRLVEPVDFEEAIVGLSRFTLRTTRVDVQSDGTDGGPAVVRATGTLSAVPAIDELLRTIVPGDFEGVPASLDYELAPDAEHLDVYLTVTWTEPTRRVPIVLHAFIQANRMQTFAPEVGFDLGTAEVPWVGFVQGGGTGYAWRSMDGNLSPLFADGGFAGFQAQAIVLEGCAQNRRHLARVVVGGPDLDGLLEAVARTEGTGRREVTGTVEEADGTPAAGVRVHAVRASDGGYLTRATTDDAGAFSLHVPADAGALELTAWRRGDGVGGPVDVAADATEATLTLPAAGAIHVVARDPAGGTPLPVRVQVVPEGELPAVPGAFGEPEPGRGRLHQAYAVDGEVTLPVPAGDHRVIVSHGFEYEMVEQSVSVAEGETVEVTADLDHVVDTTGVMCGDFHIHTHRSLDSSDEVHTKVASAAGDGVEILVRSDHEWVGDFQPVIDEMGLGAWAMGVGSDELSTNLYGHFGVFPLEADPSEPNGGAIPWVYTSPPDLFARVRARPESPAMIINHPRSSGGLNSSMAYFGYVGYDPVTGMVDRPDAWDDSFDLVEVFNDSDFESNRDGSVRDWFSFLDRGRHVFAVGSSDSHRVSTNPVGYPRTCLTFGTDDPGAITPEQVRDVLESGAATVSGGIYVQVTGPDGVGPGQTATGVGPEATLHVTVQAASFVDATRLEVIVNGETTETITLDDSTADPLEPTVRLDEDIVVPVADGAIDTWVVLVAAADTDLAPVYPGRRPFGVTNPIFLSR